MPLALPSEACRRVNVRTGDGACFDIIDSSLMLSHLCHRRATGPVHVVEAGSDVILEFFSRLGDK